MKFIKNTTSDKNTTTSPRHKNLQQSPLHPFFFRDRKNNHGKEILCTNRIEGLWAQWKGLPYSGHFTTLERFQLYLAHHDWNTFVKGMHLNIVDAFFRSISFSVSVPFGGDFTLCRGEKIGVTLGRKRLTLVL